MFLLLSWGHVSFKEVHIMGISSEDTLIIHDVASISLIFILIVTIGISLPEFLLALHYFGLRSLECLGHFKIGKFII